MSEAVVVDARRGTALWGINRFRSDALVELLNDLVDLERVGLEEKYCSHVKTALARVVNAATSVPDGSWWRGSIWAELQQFEDIYATWNSHEGTDPEIIERRRKELKKLRKRRNRISRKIRQNQYILENELDLQLIRDTYDAMGGLAKALPDMFKHLAEAVARFNTGMTESNGKNGGDKKA